MASQLGIEQGHPHATPADKLAYLQAMAGTKAAKYDCWAMGFNDVPGAGQCGISFHSPWASLGSGQYQRGCDYCSASQLTVLLQALSGARRNPGIMLQESVLGWQLQCRHSAGWAALGHWVTPPGAAIGHVGQFVGWWWLKPAANPIGAQSGRLPCVAPADPCGESPHEPFVTFLVTHPPWFCVDYRHLGVYWAVTAAVRMTWTARTQAPVWTDEDPAHWLLSQMQSQQKLIQMKKRHLKLVQKTIIYAP